VLAEKIVTLKLPDPLCVPTGTSVRSVIETVQRHRIGAILVCEAGRPVGIITERDVLMKVVARDVNYDDPVDNFMTPDPQTLTANDTVGDAIALMTGAGFRNIPIVDATTGAAVALFRVRDVIYHLAEAFPEHVLNLPPRPHQRLETPEGA
jgi:CBS domain-containing protein